MIYFAIVLISSGAIGAESLEKRDCGRGEPTPWIVAENTKIKSQSFNQTSPTESTETVILRSGDTFTISNSGCEYYVVTIRYEFKEPQSTRADEEFWFKKSASVLKAIGELTSSELFDLDAAAEALIAETRNKEKPKFGRPRPVEGDGLDFLQTRVVVEDASFTRTGGLVEIRLFKGPL